MSCVHCGECCTQEVCPVGEIAEAKLSVSGCEFLFPAGGMMWCKLAHLSAYLPGHKVMVDSLGIGNGCTNDFI
jgi:hypothetical protein